MFRSSILVLSALTSSAFAAAPAKSKSFNPDISVNFLGLYQHDTRGSKNRTAKVRNGLQLQEAETQFTADVDPYFRASALFAVAQKDNSTEWGIDPEEVFLESLSLPVVTVKAGKFKAALGKHNQLHAHAYPFIDAPMINTDFLGDEGLNDAGLSVAGLVPLPWFFEITVQALGTSNEKLFNSTNSGDFAQVLALRNLWDLSDDLTFEFTPYGTHGPDSFGKYSWVYGADVIFKWRPAEGGKYKALIWQTEFLSRHVYGSGFDGNGPVQSGLASWVQWQFAERWWLQARAEYEGVPKSPELGAKRKQSALLGFFPSEFSGIRIQYDHLNSDNLIAGDTRVHDSHSIALQYNISIGAHPAHAY